MLVEGPSKKDPRCGRAAPARTSSCTSRRACTRPRSAAPPTSSSPTPRRTGCAATWSRVEPAPRPARIRIPVTRARACVTAPHLALVGPTASGKSALALAVGARARRRRDRVGRLDAGLPRPRHRHRQAHARRAGARCRTTCRRRRPDRRVVGGALPGTRHAPRSPTSSARGKRALLVGGTGLYVQAVIDPLTFPPEDRDRPRRDARRRDRDARRPRAPPTPSSQRVDPDRRGAHRARQRPAHRARARGDPAHRASRSRRSVPGSQAFGATGVPGPHRRRVAPAGRPRRPHRAPVRGDARRRPGRRGARPARAAARSRAPPRRRSGTGRCSPTSTVTIAVARRRVRGRGRPHPPVRPPPTHVVPPRSPHHAGSGRPENPCSIAARPAGKLERMS